MTAPLKIGIALPQTDWPSGRPWSLGRMVEYGVRAEELGFGSLWLCDHLFIEEDGERSLLGGEPLVLLSYLAARTSSVQLGTLVLCAPFRSPVQLAREARTLAELSDGRFVLGLGAGWHDPELEAAGLPTDRLHSRLREYVAVLGPLLDGDRVDYDGRYQRLAGAQVAGSARPPLWLATGGERGLQLTGAAADGWNPTGPDPDALLARLRAEEAAAGRAPGSVVASTGIAALLAPQAEAERLVAAHPAKYGPPVIGPDALRAAVAARHAAGFEHLILTLSGEIWTGYGGLEQLELAAEALGLGPYSAASSHQ